MSVVLIAAVAKNGIIGRNNNLVWSDPEDMKHFKKLTTGKTVLMGRKTWESLPEKFRPLPDRLNAVITRQADYTVPEGVLRFSFIQDAIEQLKKYGDICVIGGGEIYAQAMPFADTLEITHIHKDIEGDIHFPNIDPSVWEVASEEQHQGFTFATYTRHARLHI